MKRVWRNLSKGKKIAGLVVLCLAVVVGYFSYHRLTARADGEKPYYYNWNTWTEDTPSKDWDLSQQAGSEKNPFVVMEIVPYAGNALFGIQTENCETFEMDNTVRGNIFYTNGDIGAVLGTLFEDEYQRALEVDYKGNETEFRKRYSEYFLPASDLGVTKEYSAIGYYEKVAPGTGDFIYTGQTYEDSASHVSTIPIKTKVNGVEQTVEKVYRPKFEKVGKNQGDWKWESMGYFPGESVYSGKGAGGDDPNGTGSTCSPAVFMSFVEYENKFKLSPDEAIVYKELGAREYTVRTDTEYRMLPTNDTKEAATKILIPDEYKKNPHTAPNIIMKACENRQQNYFRYYNSLIRTGFHVYSEDARANFHMVIKTITPQELNAHPEWIDYADLMYLHRYSGGSGAEQYYDDAKVKKVVSPLGKRAEFTAEDDFTWGVASMMFQKTNGVGRYASTTGAYDAAKDLYNFAPLISDFVGLAQFPTNDTKSVTTYRLDYGTLEPFLDANYKGNSGSGKNCNMYKLYYMTLFMEPENFYKMFFTYDKKSGGTVIPAENIVKNTTGSFNADYTLKPEWFNKDGACTSQGIAPNTDKNAEIYWNEWTFMPMDKFRNNNPAGNCDTEFLDHFGINYVNGGQSVLINATGTDKDGKQTETNVMLNGGTFMYNSGSEFGRNMITNNFERTGNTEDAFKWYEESEGMDLNDRGISPIEMVYYLLNYQKGGNTDNDHKDRDKVKVRILEIEPCNDYVWKDETLVNAFFPSSRFETEVTCMTSQEYTGREPDYVNDFDMVYMGLTDGKFNHKDQKVQFKNTALSKIIDYNDADYDFDTKKEEDGNLIFSSLQTDHKLAAKFYLHVGDLIKAGSKDYRLSGNDLSSISNKSLKKYINQNRGVVILDDDLATTGSTTHNRRVDSSSYIHNLACTAMSGSHDNVSKYGDVKGSYVELSKKLFTNKSIGRSLVDVVETPAQGSLASAGSTDASGATSSEKVKNMVFRFVLNPSEMDQKYGVKVDDDLNSIKYGIKFYIDINNDGIIKDATDNSNGEMVYDSVADIERMQKYCDENTELAPFKSQFVETYQPQENAYTIDMWPVVKYVFDTRKIARKTGALSWKFVLYDTANSHYEIATSGVGQYTAEDQDADKNVITFYQVVEDASQNLLNNKLFSECMTEIKDGGYSISDDSQCVTLNEFTKLYKDKIATLGSRQEQLDVFLEENPYYPSTAGGGTKFDVIIISCGSSLQSKADAGVIAYLQELSEDGVGLIFTEGSAAAKNSSDTVEKASAQKIKDVLNQSRFTTSDEDYRDLPYYAIGKTNVAANTTSVSLPIAKPNIYSLEGEQMEYTYTALTTKGDSGQLLCFDKDKWKTADGSAKMTYKASGDALKTTTLTRINKGKLTTYPFNIPETIEINKTAAQDYQLNMHNPDARVWYCLGGEDNSLYGISPNDATNNYYLYNTENIIYTSADFKGIQDSNTKDEMKLFINSLVFSYDSSSSYPKVVVTRMDDLDKGKDVVVDSHPDYKDTEQYLYFTAGMNYTGKSYQDYIPGAGKFTPNGAVAAFPNVAGNKETIEDDPEETPAAAPTATAEPTPVPTTPPDPIDLSTGWGSFQSYDNTKLGTLGDDAVLVIKYHLTSQWNGNQWSEANDAITVNANNTTIVKKSTAKDDTVGKELTLIVPMSEIKGVLGSNWPLNQISIGTTQWFWAIDSAIFYYNMDQYEPPVSSSDTIIATEPPKVTLSPNFVKNVGRVSGSSADADKYKDHLTDMRTKYGYSHRIYFKPVDNTAPGGKIQRFRISIVNRPADQYHTPKIEDFTEEKNGETVMRDDMLVTYIPAVYFVDATGYVFRYKAAKKDAAFSVEKRNYVEDGKEYFFLFDEYYRDDYLVQFEITNLKKTGYSYLDPKSETPNDNTYLFDLD